MRPRITTFLARENAREYPERTLDQRFLRETVWPIARQSLCAHDSVYRYRGAGAFPEYGRRAAGRHVGQDDSVRGAGTAQRDQAGRLLAVPTVTF
jgi:hypothetical protein